MENKTPTKVEKVVILSPEQIEGIKQAKEMGEAMVAELNRAKEAGEEIY